jgi:serpin B
MNIVSGQTEQTQVNNDFSLNLFEKVISLKGDSSVVVSPLGVNFMLGMLDNGATGQTAEEINKTLGVSDASILASYHQNMMTTYRALDPKTEFGIANCIILNQTKGYSFLPAYVDSMQTKYNALIRFMNFNESSTLDYINHWSSEKTKGMIPQILGNLNPNLVWVLMNSIYFKGIWSTLFDPNFTSNGQFLAADGSKQIVKMMSSEVAREYAENDTYQILKLDYGNKSYSMYFILPQKGCSLLDVISAMKKTDWIKTPKMTQRLGVGLPKFTTESFIDLSGIIKGMGMPTMFDPAKADFSDMMDFSKLADNLYVDMFLQKAKIEVDENGTKAAATTVTGGTTGLMEHYFYANHPFLYAIVENATSTICFIGQYTGIGAASTEDGTDGIVNPIEEIHQKGLYDISGRKLNAVPSKGLYIMDGKKMIAK